MAGRWMSLSEATRFSNYGLVGLGFVGCVFHLGVNHYGLEKYKSYVQMYTDGVPKELSPEMKERTLEVLRIAKIAKRNKPDVKFFHVYGDDMFHAGSQEIPAGAIIGIPHNFNYKSIDDVDTKEINVLNGQAVKWDSKSGKKLLDSLVFSPGAQKFAIAREIYFTEGHFIHLQCVAVFVSIILAKAMVETVKKAKNIMARPLAVRAGVYFLAACMGWFNYCLLGDGMQCYYERFSDEKAASTNDEYYDGALEYYTKLMARNKAFRKMLGAKGPQYFTSEGDVRTGVIRTPSLALTQRFYNINELKNPEKEY